jgi:hypothetical protein
MPSAPVKPGKGWGMLEDDEFRAQIVTLSFKEYNNGRTNVLP